MACLIAFSAPSSLPPSVRGCWFYRILRCLFYHFLHSVGLVAFLFAVACLITFSARSALLPLCSQLPCFIAFSARSALLPLCSRLLVLSHCPPGRPCCLSVRGCLLYGILRSVGPVASLFAVACFIAFSARSALPQAAACPKNSISSIQCEWTWPMITTFICFKPILY